MDHTMRQNLILILAGLIFVSMAVSFHYHSAITSMNNLSTQNETYKYINQTIDSAMSSMISKIESIKSENDVLVRKLHEIDLNTSLGKPFKKEF